MRLLSIALLAIAVLLTACGKSETAAPGSGPNAKKIVIGFVAKSNSNPVFQAAHAGAKDAAKELAGQYNATIEINIQTPAEEDANRQAEAIDSLVGMKVSGIAVSCSDANKLTAAINRAVDAGIPVICFDSDAPKSKRFAYYGTDDAACGKRVMEILAKEMGDKGTIAILAGNPAAPNLQARTEGVRTELKKHPKITEISGGAVYHEETAAKAAEKLQAVQNANASITGWALIGGWPLFTRDALKWEPGKIKCVSVDALPPQLKYLESGHVQVLLAQDCYGWGYKSVELLLNKIVKNESPKDPMVIDPLTEVTKQNAAEWNKKWDKWLK